MTKNAAWPEGSFLDSLATGVLATDPKGKIVYANAASEILSGASKNRLLGISAEAVFPSARRWTERFLSDTVRGEPTLTERTEMFCPSNPTESRKVRVTVSRFPGTGGILMEVSDLGAVLIAENEAQKVGLSETSRQVLRNLAHEIKNPLGGIRGAAQLLEGELTNPELREYTGVIISEADRLQNLVDRLLAPYRTGRSLSDINIHEVLERVRQIILAEFPKGLSFIRDYDVSVPTLRGDREQLLQVFLNIEKNAAEALDGKIAEGTAEIRVITRVAQQVQIGLRRYRLALSRSENAVVMITGSFGYFSLIRVRRSMPLGPGIRISEIRTPGQSFCRAVQAAFPSEKDRQVNPAFVSTFSRTQRIERSSSTIQTSFMSFSP